MTLPDMSPALPVDPGANPGTAATAGRSPFSLSLQRFWANIGARVSVMVLTLLILVVVFVPIFLPYGPNDQNLLASRKPPSAGHWLGTDLLGQDVLARLLAGGRISLLVGFATALSALVIGTVVGVVSGWRGGPTDTVLMRTTDLFMAIPSMLVVIVVGGILGPSLFLLVALLAAFAWPVAARIARSVVLQVRELDYVLAARAAGTRPIAIMFRHLLPAVIPQVTVAGAVMVVGAILAEAGLSYLGLGVVPPQASWGNMLQAAQSYSVISGMPWLWLPPGIAITITAISVIFIGDGLRDALDPKASR
jgi:peptide/nickel transport system permease protein